MNLKVYLNEFMKYHDCPLCSSRQSIDYFNDKTRSYLKCQECFLLFVPPSFHVSELDEMKRYQLHQNSIDDHGYREFIGRILDPIALRVKKGGCGLDFGSGPNPVLATLLKEIGYEMNIYDLYFASQDTVLQQQYDFISATEVFEHLRNPKQQLNSLFKCLKKGGFLFVMTALTDKIVLFSDWHYITDLTHVCFYSRKTFEWIARKWNFEISFIDKNVAVFHKK
ncbi:MAG: class I SAM-dependent methyltransferase [bacterium]|nr:class I SAM-dependent methyltransferase [bacterium]